MMWKKQLLKICVAAASSAVARKVLSGKWKRLRLGGTRLVGVSATVLLLLFCGTPNMSALELIPSGFVYPIVYPRVSSMFGMRKHPILRVRRHHDGIDLVAPIGTPIRTIAAGRVVFADPLGGYGNLVVIEHKPGLTSHYGHCDTMRVEPGQMVSSGQIIATLGNTGRTTGPHLHFEIRMNGKPIDPLTVIPGLTLDAEG